MKYKYFFWDFDGMLCDTYPHVQAAFIKALRECGREEIDEKKVYDDLKINFGEAIRNFNMEGESLRLFNLYYRDLSLEPHSYLFPHIEDILKIIVEKGGKNFIYTNRDEVLFEYLDEFDIRKYFTDFKISARKPTPEPLYELFEKYSLDKAECVVVGDRNLDCLGGKNAGIDGILFDPEYREKDIVARFVIRDTGELYEFV
jgi:HAD superfamily hydrolase (TIGR01549 family)